jgi:hypothetical protein
MLMVFFFKNSVWMFSCGGVVICWWEIPRLFFLFVEKTKVIFYARFDVKY